MGDQEGQHPFSLPKPPSCLPITRGVHKDRKMMNIAKALAVFRLLIWSAAGMMDRPTELGAQCLLQCL